MSVDILPEDDYTARATWEWVSEPISCGRGDLQKTVTKSTAAICLEADTILTLESGPETFGTYLLSTVNIRMFPTWGYPKSAKLRQFWY